MKKITLLLFAVAVIFTSSFAQITIADGEGNPLEDGQTYELPNHSEPELPFIITNNSGSDINYILEVISATPEGADCPFQICGGGTCNDLTADWITYPWSVGIATSIAAGVSTTVGETHITYVYNEGVAASIEVHVYEEGNTSNSVTFTYGYVVDINSVTSGFYVYPNPATDVLYITNTNNNSSYVLINNIIGQTVKRIELTNETTKANIADLENGIYIYTLYEDSKAVITRKLIKK